MTAPVVNERVDSQRKLSVLRLHTEGLFYSLLRRATQRVTDDPPSEIDLVISRRALILARQGYIRRSPLGMVGNPHKALDAQKLCARGLGENGQEKIERRARHRSAASAPSRVLTSWPLPSPFLRRQERRHWRASSRPQHQSGRAMIALRKPPVRSLRLWRPRLGRMSP